MVLECPSKDFGGQKFLLFWPVLGFEQYFYMIFAFVASLGGWGVRRGDGVAF